MSELKKCPFCGGSNIYVDGYDHDAGKRWRVVCLDCMATVDDGCIQQKYRAIEAWNRRADMPTADVAPVVHTGCVWCNERNTIFHDGEHFNFFCSYCGRKLERSDT